MVRWGGDGGAVGRSQATAGQSRGQGPAHGWISVGDQHTQARRQHMRPSAPLGHSPVSKGTSVQVPDSQNLTKSPAPTALLPLVSASVILGAQPCRWGRRGVGGGGWGFPGQAAARSAGYGSKAGNRHPRHSLCAMRAQARPPATAHSH